MSYTLIKPYFKKNLFTIGAGVFSLVILDLLLLVIPRITKMAIDDLTALKIDGYGLLKYAGFIVGLSIVVAGLRYVARRFLFGTSRRLEEGLRNQLFKHIQTLSAAYFDQAKTGDLMAHATNDIQHIRMATGMGMVALTDALFLGAATLGFMAYINLKLTLIVFIPMPMIIFGSRIFSRKMHRRYQRVQASFADLTEEVRERFAGIRVIKSFNREKHEIDSLAGISKDYIQKNMGLARITGSFFPMMQFFSNLSLALILYIGGRLTILSVLSPGDFVAFIAYLGLMTWPMMAMGWVVSLIQRGKASLDRIENILKTPSDITDKALPAALNQTSGKIEFSNVSFRYKGRERRALENISFTLSPGNVLGIVGPQGSGKTALLNLIPRLYDIETGRILLDGIDIRDIKIEHLRSKISYMPQEPILFAGTIADNIRFDSDEEAPYRLTQAARTASLYDTVKSFSKGFDTVVGEKGVILSGGQKQRVGLARAILNDTPILLLDDPISQVDKETGDTIIRSIRSFARSKTMIIVSHRLSAVEFADRIIILDNGQIVTMGTHAELIKQSSYYQKTFHMQEMERDLNVW